MAAAFSCLPRLRARASRRAYLPRAALALAIPAVAIACVVITNVRSYGSPFPGGDEYALRRQGLADFVSHQPRDRSDMDFASFQPWRFIDQPLLAPGKLNQFWTLLHAGAWFDTDAKFFLYSVPDGPWVDGFGRWMAGAQEYPGGPPPRAVARFLGPGRILITLGLVVVAVLAWGVRRLLRLAREGEPAAVQASALAAPLLVLVAFNVAGVALWAQRVPVYSAVKAAFLLPSFSAMTALFAFGIDALAAQPGPRRASLALCGAAAVVATFHIAQLVAA